MSDLVIVRRILTTLTAVLVGASALAVVPVALPSAQGEGEPTLATSVAEGLTGTSIQVSGTGCYLPDGITGSDGVLFQLIAPDGSAAASGTLPVERDGTWDAPFVVPNGVPAGTYGVKGTCIAPMYEDLGVVTAEPFTVTGAGAPVPEREPATPRFPNEIEAYPTYDGQSTCSPAPKPGMIAYRDMVMRAYPGVVELRHQPGLLRRRDQRAQGRAGLGLGQRRHHGRRAPPGRRLLPLAVPPRTATATATPWPVASASCTSSGTARSSACTGPTRGGRRTPGPAPTRTTSTSA